MKKIVFILMVLSSYVYGQEKKFTVSGTITDCKYKIVISSVTVRLVGSDGSNIEAKTDSKGYYLFDSTKVNLNTQYVITTLVGIDVKTSYAPKGYLNSSDKIKLKITSSSDKNTKVDFCLVPMTACIMRLPEFRFAKNSEIDFYPADTLVELNFAYQVLVDNPTLVIEVRGHASKDEKNSEKLAQKRAQLIKDQLVKKGISQDRLIVKSYSFNIYNEYMDDETLEVKVYNKNDEQSYKMNRRVDMNIIRKDYIPQGKKEVESTPNQNNPEEEEGE